jgi:hypothetical protein
MLASIPSQGIRLTQTQELQTLIDPAMQRQLAPTQRTPPSFTRTNALVGNLAISTFRAIHSPWEPVSSADPEPFASPQLLPAVSDSTRLHIVLDLT